MVNLAWFLPLQKYIYCIWRCVALSKFCFFRSAAATSDLTNIAKSSSLNRAKDGVTEPVDATELAVAEKPSTAKDNKSNPSSKEHSSPSLKQQRTISRHPPGGFVDVSGDTAISPSVSVRRSLRSYQTESQTSVASPCRTSPRVKEFAERQHRVINSKEANESNRHMVTAKAKSARQQTPTLPPKLAAPETSSLSSHRVLRKRKSSSTSSDASFVETKKSTACAKDNVVLETAATEKVEQFANSTESLSLDGEGETMPISNSLAGLSCKSSSNEEQVGAIHTLQTESEPFSNEVASNKSHSSVNADLGNSADYTTDFSGQSLGSRKSDSMEAGDDICHVNSHELSVHLVPSLADPVEVVQSVPNESMETKSLDWNGGVEAAAKNITTSLLDENSMEARSEDKDVRASLLTEDVVLKSVLFSDNLEGKQSYPDVRTASSAGNMDTAMPSQHVKPSLPPDSKYMPSTEYTRTSPTTKVEKQMLEDTNMKPTLPAQNTQTKLLTDDLDVTPPENVIRKYRKTYARRLARTDFRTEKDDTMTVPSSDENTLLATLKSNVSSVTVTAKKDAGTAELVQTSEKGQIGGTDQNGTPVLGTGSAFVAQPFGETDAYSDVKLVVAMDDDSDNDSDTLGKFFSLYVFWHNSQTPFS